MTIGNATSTTYKTCIRHNVGTRHDIQITAKKKYT